MNMEFKPYIVYVKTNESGYITAVNSSAFLSDTTAWVEIDSGHGDKYHHAQGNYFPNPIMTEGGAYRYKLIDGEVSECTTEEIRALEDAYNPDKQPSQLDLIEAQVTYTAMMTDTLLEV
jgi:hypothetical protein